MNNFNNWSQVIMDEISAIGESRKAKGIFFRKAKHKNPIETAHAARLCGISFSGGGIRSATFNLGILQGLANLGVLHIFDYLSTVSGGGYIGSWFSAWVFRALRTVSDPGFTEKEFEKYDLKQLCQNIENDFSHFDGASAEKRTIEWLNAFLELTSPRENINAIGEGQSYSKEIQPRLEALEALKDRHSLPGNTAYARDKIRVLNRLILEEKYGNIVPPYKPGRKDAPAKALGMVISALKTSEREAPASGKDKLTVEVDKKWKSSHEAEPIRFLRKYSNYLTPRRGFSTDSLTLGVAYTINFAVNLIVLVLILGSILTIPLLVVKGYHAISDYGLSDGFFLSTSALCLGVSLICAFLAQRKTANEKKNLFWIKAFVFFFLFAAALFSISLWLTSQVAYSWWKWSLFTGVIFAILLIVGRCCTGTIATLIKGDRRQRKQHCRILGGEILAALIAGLVSGPLFYMAACLMQKWSRNPGGLWHVAVWGYTIMLGIFGISTIVYTGIAGKSQTEDKREWTFRLWALIAKYACSIATLLIVGVYGPILLQAAEKHISVYIGYLLTAGWLSTTIGRVLTWKKEGQNQKQERGISRYIATAAPYIFILGLVLALAVGLQKLWISAILWLKDLNPASPYWNHFISTTDRWATGSQPALYWKQLDGMLYYWLVPLAGLLIFFMVAVMLSWRVGVNEFSLHSLYGNRLVRAYLGASNPDTSNGPWRSRRDPFTFFNPGDNSVRLNFLSSLYDKDVIYPGPYPIINTTINLSKSKNLAWQKRKGASFIFSSLYSGFDGYLSTDEAPTPMGTRKDRSYVPTGIYSSDNGVSLGKAMTISGAAASPNMGYYTSQPLAFLMTIFNLRLGWWLGNPVKGKPALLRSKGPKMGFPYLLAELIAKAGDDSRYIYLSDGGHFENLGIYELVKRRCRYIVACDASRDEDMEFNDLGNAIEKCRTDFGIDILINVDQIRKRNGTGPSAWHCAVGQIRYSAIDNNAQDGTLFYIKASLTGDEPLDIVRYASQCPDFPHQSTADQWFDETQFESYRRLGEHIAGFVFQDAIRNDEVHLSGNNRHAQTYKLPEIRVETLFHELKKKWYPPIPEFEKTFSRHAAGLERIISKLKTTKNLHYLDVQMYPVFSKLDKLLPKGKRFYGHLPKNGEELREGFYLCKEMLVFMESVYHDLNLDENFEHPDNRGWINLFQRWSWSRMFRFTWSVTGSTFGARFQTFCEQKMKFKKFEIKVGIDKKKQDILPGLKVDDNIIKEYAALNKKPGRPIEEYTSDNLEKFWKSAQKIYDFNYFEIKLMVNLIVKNLKTCNIFPVFIRSENNPLIDNKKFDFNVGFIIMDSAEENLYYFRIQNHLRQMGLARETLRVFLSDKRFGPHKVGLKLMMPSDDAPEAPTPESIEDFKMLFQTMQSEVEASRLRREFKEEDNKGRTQFA